MDDIWRDALLFHKWANQKVLDACANLSGEQLRLTAPGTYGTIADTLQHLLSAERGYVRRLTNAERIRSQAGPFPGVEALKGEFAKSDDALMEAAAALKPEDTTVAEYDDGDMVTLRQSLVVVQAIHHGNDHRTHIYTILGSHGIPFEEIDVWGYGLVGQC
jgi:uncharacterized damage-inducible protein DinB